MEIKNKTVNIFGTKYKILFVDNANPDIGEGEYSFGICDSTRFIIRISIKDIDGKPLSEDIIKISLLHELFHAILNEGQYRGSSDDEPLVEWLAKCTNSILNQKVI